MPTWGEILIEMQSARRPDGTPDFDAVRRKYMRQLHARTHRAVILYATAFLEDRPIPPSGVQVGLGDIQGFMEAVSNIEERQLDLILHSPGGSAEAAESIVAYLRQRFDHIRVFIPVAAMSAATMIALAANEVVMGQHSQLGPIDPQFIIATPEGPRSAPARAILKQFEMGKLQCKDPGNLAAWMPILRSYAPGLLTQCEDSQRLAETMVSSWLQQYMFAGQPNAADEAARIAHWFGDYDNFSSHGRRVGYDQAREVGVEVHRLEDDNDLQDAVLSVHHAAMQSFGGSAIKIIENHHGRTWAKHAGEIVIAQPGPRPTQQGPQVAQPAPVNRQERRAQERGRGGR
ncbi:MAG: serine protease [Dehalococcoidia bacterium]|nr:serine protease [Dehalococcoidia bacterium]